MRWRARVPASARPDRLARTLAAIRRWGASPPGAVVRAAIAEPQRTAIVDEHGTLTFAALESRSNALARALLAGHAAEGSTVAIMCRNHRWFIEATVACCKLGAHVLYLDPALASDEIADALAQEDPVAVIHDEEFSELMSGLASRRRRIIAWRESTGRATPSLEELIWSFQAPAPRPPRTPSRAVLLAAPTGVPGHEARYWPCSLELPAALLGELPLRRAGTTVMAAPMCRPLGFLHLKLALRLRSTLVLRRHADAAGVLEDVELHRASALVVSAHTLNGIDELGRAAAAGHETASLRLIAVDGWALPAVAAAHGASGSARQRRRASAVKLNGRWVSVQDAGSPLTLEAAG